MKTIYKKIYECPKVDILTLKSRRVFLTTSFGLDPLTEDNTDADNVYTQF